MVFSDSLIVFPFLIVCFAVAILVFILRRYFFWKERKSWKMIENFPGPPTFPVFGNALLLNRENHELFEFSEDMVKLYGKISKIWLFYKPYVLIADANVVEKILTSKISMDKGDDLKVFHSWWGSGLLTASGTKWRTQRKLLNQTFGHSILLNFLEVFEKESVFLIKRLEPFSQNGEICDLIPFLTTTTLNIICETAMGKKLGSEGTNDMEYIDAVTGMYHILLSRMTRPWLRPDIIWKFSPYGFRERKYLKVLHGFTDRVIKEKKQLRQTQKEWKCQEDSETNTDTGIKTRMVFMDYLLDLGETHSLTDIDIRNEVDTFMAAGHDTTAYTVCWTLFLLATYPQHQIAVHEELDAIFGNKSDHSLSAQDLSEMKYLNLCIKEAIRIYPIVPFNLRKLSEDVDCGNEQTIPSGTNVVIMPYILHKDPHHFPNPEEFRPDRFLAENCLSRHPFAYIPFSAGARNCIGQKFGMMEAKVILAHLLRSYYFEPLEDRGEIKLDLDLVTRPMHGLHFKIKKRK